MTVQAFQVLGLKRLFLFQTAAAAACPENIVLNFRLVSVNLLLLPALPVLTRKARRGGLTRLRCNLYL
jgi:hypothetical protein